MRFPTIPYLPTISDVASRYPYPFITTLSLWKKLLICITFAVLIMGSALAMQWTHAQIKKSGYHRKTTSDPAKLE